MTKKTVDIFIPTYMPGTEFAQLLRSLANQVYPIHRILVTNTESRYWPECVNFCGIDHEICHISREEFDHGGTRDAMARRSTSEIFICMTQDAIPADDYLVERLVEALEQPKAAAAYARQLPNEDCRYIERIVREFNYPAKSKLKTKKDLDTMGVKAFFCSDVCAAYKKDIYVEQGGFPRPTIFNEDMIFAGRLLEAGYGIAYAADARVFHSHNYTAKQQYHRNFDLAVSQVMYPDLFEKYPSEAEGRKMVMTTARKVCTDGKPWLVFPLVWYSAAKYFGYRKGKKYRSLSRKQIQKSTSNPGFWK